MPIEIKELHIRVSVNTTQGTPAAAGASTAGNAGKSDGEAGTEAKDAIIAECVEQVLQILRDKGALTNMAPNGKLEKMLILAFDTSADAESGGRTEAKDHFEALINPETYALEYKVKTAEGQGHGTSGAQAKFQYTLPEELTFEFLFDNTGIIDDKPQKDGIFDDVNHFKTMLTGYQGKSHEPYHLKLVWGNLIFKGRAIELGITYKLFNPDGQPIRAVAKVKFKGSIEEKKRAAKENKSSPDLTHVRRVKAGDTLPLLCYQIYGDPRYYLLVAEKNKLAGFRTLQPGQEIYFPPIEKQSPLP